MELRMIAVSVDNEQVQLNLKNVGKALKNGVPKALMNVALEIMRLSQLEVPHDKGTLQNSGTVEDQTDGSIIIGYHTDYAARLHEHPEYRFQKGRKGKYLEDPIRNNAEVLGVKFAKNTGDDIQGAIK